MQDRFGINMKRYCRAHEAMLASVPPSREVMALHLEKLRWLQHERLVHLVVLVLTAVAELFTVDMAVLHPETNPLAAIVMLALAVLLAFYFAPTSSWKTRCSTGTGWQTTWPRS